MEIFRALAVLVEPPDRLEAARLAALLGLGEPPTVSEYTDTFAFQFYPYASVYLGAEGMLGGEARDRIAGFWRALGQTPPTEPDHLAVMLATYAQLSSPWEARSAVASPSSDASEVADEGPGALDESVAEDTHRPEALRAARVAFLWEHLLSWLPVYLDRVAEVAPPFYRRWAELLASALLEEAKATPAPDALPLHLREAPQIADPRASSTDEFLQTLLAPARSGLIIVRSDLSRAARSHGITLRAGERKYALKSFVDQDARGSLAWLAAEASRQAARHARRRDALGAIAEWWSARARATGKLLRELESDAGELS
ncbi:MAG TPA: molecular chaperone TorD family protein [Pyrinomonadaceae bacterium]|nr:molecular chaperone TorD family protein [Pyrinomonadaceae bacterium]